GFQNELDTIGKRPDWLIFKKSDFDINSGYDISQIPHNKLTDYVKKAVAVIEVLSSAFLIDKYEEVMQIRTEKFSQLALQTRDKILANYSDLLEHPKRKIYIEKNKGLKSDNLSIENFRTPSWSSPERLVE